MGLESVKIGRNGKYAQFLALLKAQQPPSESQRSQKRLKYMPASSRYFRKTFEYTNYIGEFDKGLKQPKND